MNAVVVVDSGPLIHLAQADVLPLLELTGELLIPETVLTEIDPESTDLSGLTFSRVSVDYDPESTYPHLDAGETAALVVCQQHDGILLTDDLDARTTANDEGIEVHGSIGVVLYAYSQGKLTNLDAEAALHDLERDTNLYLSAPLVEYAIELIVSNDAGW